MLWAYNYQEVALDVSRVIEEIKSKTLEPDIKTNHLIVDYICRNNTVEAALDFIATHKIDLSERLAWSLIFGHSAAGEVKKAEQILVAMNEKNIHWARGLFKAFVLGSAKCGDVEATNFFLSKGGGAPDALLLESIEMMNKTSQKDVGFLLDRLPVSAEIFSSQCRRTIKMLLETGNTEAAWSLVSKCRDVKENNSDKDRVIKISPSVIALKHFILNCDKRPVESIRDQVHKIKQWNVDKRIHARAVTVLVDIAFEHPDKANLARQVIKQLMMDVSKEELQTIRNYVGQNSKRRIKEASSVSNEEVVKVFNTYCVLGLTIDKIGAWDLMMKSLIPDIPDHGTWSRSELVDTAYDVKKLLSNNCQGLYSQSVVWSHIIQRLMNRENALFFSTAANLCSSLKVAYGPARWYLSLANSVVETKDVKSFVDILETCYKNCERKGEWRDYDVLCSSIYAAIVKAQNRQIDVDKLVGDILDELWRRNMKIPAHFREDIMGKLRDKKLRILFENVPVLGSNVFKRVSRDGIV